jgi:acyl carrier protein
MENLENLEKKVTEKILERLELDMDLKDVSYTAPLFDSIRQSSEKSLGLDSVDGLELAVMLYETWGIKVRPEEMPGLTTIESIADFIRRKHPSGK